MSQQSKEEEHLKKVVNLLQEFHKTQVILYADISNNENYGKETKNSADKFVTLAKPLLFESMKYYVKVFSIIRLAKGKLDKDEAIRLANLIEEKPTMNPKTLQKILACDDLFKVLQDKKIDNEDFIDLVTFIIIPSYFKFWLTNSSIENYVNFMKRVFDEGYLDQHELFYKFARSAFVHPGFCSFISKSIEPAVRRQLGLYGKINNQKETITMIEDLMKKNFKICPAFITELFLIGGDLMTFTKSCISLVGEYPKLFNIIFYYDNLNGDFLTKPEGESLLDTLCGSTIIHEFKKDKNMKLTYAFPTLTTEIAKYIEKVHIVDSFAEKEFYEIIGEEKSNTCILKNLSGYKITIIAPEEKNEFKNAPTPTNIPGSFTANLRKVMKLLPIIPEFDVEHFPYKYALGNEKYTFSLSKIIQDQIPFADKENMDNLFTCYSTLMEENDFTKHEKLADKESIRTIRNALAGVLYEHNEMAVNLSKAFTANTFSKNVSNQMEEANKHLSGLIIAMFTENHEFRNRLSDDDIKNIIQSPCDVLRSQNAFVREVSRFIDNILREPSGSFKRIAQNYKNHIIFKVVPYEKFISARIDAVAADAAFTEYIKQNKVSIMNKALEPFNDQSATLLKLITKRRAFDSIQTLLYDTLISNYDPQQKKENMDTIWKACENICIHEGIDLETSDMKNALANGIIAFYNPLRIVSNYVFINDYIDKDKNVTSFIDGIVDDLCEKATGLNKYSFVISRQQKSYVFVCGNETSGAKDFICDVTGLTSIPDDQKVFRVRRDGKACRFNIDIMWVSNKKELNNNEEIKEKMKKCKFDQKPENSIVFACKELKDFKHKEVYFIGVDNTNQKGAKEYKKENCEEILMSKIPK